MNDRLSFVLSGCVTAALICLVGAVILGFSPWFETRFFPVVANVAAYDWRQEEPGKWSAEIHMEKLRSCPPTVVWGMNFAGENSREGKAALVTNPIVPPPYEVPIVYIDDDTPGSSHPAIEGRQSFGRWVFGSAGRPVYAGNDLIFEPTHDCHPLFSTSSPVGPIRVNIDTQEE